MPKIEIYSTPSCHFCHMAKDYFKSLNLEFVDHDVQNDIAKRNEVIARSGQMGVPVIFINDQMVIGFDKEKIDELLGGSKTGDSVDPMPLTA